jgi:hypothetical protein
MCFMVRVDILSPDHANWNNILRVCDCCKRARQDVDAQREGARGVRNLFNTGNLCTLGASLARVDRYIELASVLALQYFDC